MTYIWNRANRVPVELMPEAIREPFKKWAKEKNKELNKAIVNNDSVREHQIRKTIKTQEDNYSDAVKKFK